MYCDIYYFAALSIAEAAADIEQDSSDIPATVSAAATAPLASAVPLTCFFPRRQQPTSKSTAHNHYSHIYAKLEITAIILLNLLCASWYNL